MQSYIETIVFLLVCCLGMLLYGRAIYIHSVNKYKNPDYAKKIVLKIIVRFILILLLMAIVSFVNRFFQLPKAVLYVCLAILIVLFIGFIRNIRGVMQDS